MLFSAIYLLLPAIIYGAFWAIILIFPACPLLFILSYHFERKNLTKKYKHSVPNELHIVGAEHFRLLIFGNVAPLIMIWLLTLLPFPILQSQELMLTPLIVLGILCGSSNFEILGESTARFFFIRE
jgi:hypothetical protein